MNNLKKNLHNNFLTKFFHCTLKAHSPYYSIQALAILPNLNIASKILQN